MSTSLENFGNELKNKREEKNISLRDMYEKTRIDPKYLEEIENGNFGFMPDVYIRAFIRKYADIVDFQPDEAIEMYDAAKAGKSIEELSAETENNNPTDNKSGINENINKNISTVNKSKSKLGLILPAIIGAIIVIIIFFYFRNSNNEEIIIEPRVEDIINEQNSDNGSPRFEINNNVNDNSVAKQDSVFLKINAIDTVWFRIKIDGKTSDEFILHPEHSKTLIAASRINLVVGNSAGVEMFLNGKKLPFKGRKGEIRNLSIDLNGLHYTKNTSKK